MKLVNTPRARPISQSRSIRSIDKAVCHDLELFQEHYYMKLMSKNVFLTNNAWLEQRSIIDEHIRNQSMPRWPAVKAYVSLQHSNR